MYNRTLLIGRISHNAEAKTDKNQQEYVVLSIATKDSWKNDQGDYESRIEWHRVYAWRNLSRFAKTLQKGNSSASMARFGCRFSRSSEEHV
jgi:single-strand DNA-binding protein